MKKSTKTKTSQEKTEGKKKGKVEKGLTTKEVAAHLKISPYSLRIILRKQEFYPDKKYTSYGWADLGHPEIKRLEKLVAVGAHKKTGTKKSSKKS